MPNEFDSGPGARGNIMSENTTYFDKSESVLTLTPWTVTLVTVTSPIGFVGDRPAILPAGMAAATDGGNYCIGTAGIRPQAGKKIGFVFTLYTAVWADPKLFAGFGVVSTTAAANANGGAEHTDVIGVKKTTASSAWSLYARKASGTSASVPLSHDTPVASVWQRGEMWVTRDLATAGKGKIDFYFGADALEQLPLVHSYTFPTQFPDTVSLAPQFGWLSGANNTGVSFGSAGWQIRK